MKKSYLIYGLVMGLLLIVLQIIEYKTMVRDFTLEWFGFLIGGVFLLVGVWLGTQIINKRERSSVNQPLAQATGLSAREIDVLALMADGLSNQEIADGLFVSLNTAKTHISNIYMKLNVKRRTQAVQKARALNLISLQTENHPKV